MHACLRAGALTALVVPLLAAVAIAHEGNPNFRSEIHGLEPAVPGVEAGVLNFDDSVQLRNKSESTVVVEGYEGEPYVRIQPDGTVAINQDSPSFYLNQDRFAQAPIPASADEDAPPDWRVANESGQYAWHDHRAHYMAHDTPPQVTDETERTEVFDYEIPLEVDGRPAVMRGTLVWVGRDEGVSPAPFAALAAVALLTVAVVVVWRRRRRGGDDPGRPGPREAW